MWYNNDIFEMEFSYDNELNNKFHLIIFTARRIILLGGFIFLIYTDSKNDFESFEF